MCTTQLCVGPPTSQAGGFVQILGMGVPLPVDHTSDRLGPLVWGLSSFIICEIHGIIQALC